MQPARREVTSGRHPVLVSLTAALVIELRSVDRRTCKQEVWLTEKLVKRSLPFLIHSRKEYAMKRVLSLVLAVVLVAAVLAPIAPVNAAGFKDAPALPWASMP
jgi:uncharacterized membrane protein